MVGMRILAVLLSAFVGGGRAFTTVAIPSPRRIASIRMQAQRFAAWHPDCEAALNNQIAVETAASFQYLAMYAFFDRPSVALKQATSFLRRRKPRRSATRSSSFSIRTHVEALLHCSRSRCRSRTLQAMRMRRICARRWQKPLS